MSAAKRGSAEGESHSVGLDRSIDKLENMRENKEEQRVAEELKGQRARGWFEKLLTRVLSGIVYVLVIVGCFVGGLIPTAVLMALMGWLCCSEFYRISRMAGRRPHEIFGLTAAIVYAPLAAYFGLQVLPAITALLVILVGIWYVFTPRASISDVCVTVFGPLYTSSTLAYFVLMRAQDTSINGAWLPLVVIGSIWAEDSFAYLFGSTLGKHKMAPRISPNKSWEGFLGGLLGMIVVWCACAFFGVAGLTMPVAVCCAFGVGVISVMGDLFESRIKRGVGVKDSGRIMPGHGGMLDRTDSMIFGSVVAYYILVIGGIL